ncbi:cobalt ABC transporter [Rhodospirillum rubrum]|uniref:energy-coupling factor transporter transmembrane component T family protein n=1 Tax=Rhodospirillum rubrum TaxID=1085 RepID=UPI0019047A4E|nr:energy-coupling factor transporter transmembrane protein EcfT [Rhodospirillum rubrum]MBK1663517.1 cobalt ABC transporter [Rhodospirillum rubrum]MBK1677309.1 cobalt ABC transporter [Rhodospirillum rubrum]
MIAALYVPGRSILHRLPAGAKLLGLAVLGTVLFPVNNPWALCGLALAIFLVYPACGLGWRRAVGQLRALAFFLVLIAASQWWLAGWAEAVAVSARLVALVLAASLVTYTTSLSAMMAALEGPLKPFARFGLRPEVVSFALTLAIRFIPVLMGLAKETREAMAARGRERAWFALAVPMIIRALRLADQVTEAVEARGMDVALEQTAPGKTP